MRGKRFAGAGCLAITLTVASLGMQASRAFASPSNATNTGTTHCDPSSPQCGFLENGNLIPINPAIGGPAPLFVTVGPNCPSFISTDSWVLNFVSGNAVILNNPAGRFGFTAEGQGVLVTSDGTVQYTGHLQLWTNGGGNSAGQSASGFTVNYQGSGSAGSISIHTNVQVTTNNSGRPTANPMNGTDTCS